MYLSPDVYKQSKQVLNTCLLCYNRYKAYVSITWCIQAKQASCIYWTRDNRTQSDTRSI